MLPNRLTVLVFFFAHNDTKGALPAGRHGHIKPVKPDGKLVPFGHARPYVT
jgi:hypothetical protein